MKTILSLTFLSLLILGILLFISGDSVALASLTIGYVTLLTSLILPILILGGVILFAKSVYERIRIQEESLKKSASKKIWKALSVLLVPVLVITILLFLTGRILFLSPSVAIEYHAAIEIYQRPDIQKVMKKYPRNLAWVRPLNYSYIENEEFIHRILPEYSEMNIHCIIVAHSPEGDRFFLEDGDSEHVFIEVPSDEFFTSLNNAPNNDVHTFWLNLR